MNILKEGVKGALVRIVRLIVYSIIILVVFYIIGLITSHKASALSYKGGAYDPPFDNYYNTVDTGTNGYSVSGWTSKNQWCYFGFPSNNAWTNTSDYDLVGFKFNQLEVSAIQNTTPQSSSNAYDNIGDASKWVTYNAILWESNGTGIACYSSSEVANTFLCPITPNTTYNGMTVIVNIFYPPNTRVVVNLEIERGKSFYNYDSTDIINALGQITTQQTQAITNQTQIIQQQTTYITDTSISGSETQSETALNGIASEFNDILNGWGGEWSTLTHIVLEPINVILYGLDSGTTCSPIRLTIPYLNDGQYIDLPCMSGIYNTYFGTFIALFMSIMAGLYSYRTIIYIVRTIKELCDAENDKIEVIDL